MLLFWQFFNSFSLCSMGTVSYLDLVADSVLSHGYCFQEQFSVS